MTRSRQILALAKERNATIATAESCTAGMVAAALTDPAGASAIFDRGFVTYSNAAKVAMLGVKEDTLAAFGAVSEQVAREMAKGALAASGATLSVAVTGIAGPGGTEAKPEGRVCFAIASEGTVSSETRDFGALGRDAVRRESRDHALELLLSALGGRPDQP